jgi:hypothetical protein
MLVFTNHKPWWSYYYVHLALPLGWCAAIGIKSAVDMIIKLHEKTRRSLVPFICVFVLILTAAALWIGGRLYVQIKTVQALPRTYASLLLQQVARYRPYTHWLYTEDLTLSFHADIPMPPPLAVMPLKRWWSGEMTPDRLALEFARYQPEQVVLENQSMGIAFQEQLDRDYRLVYQDEQERLYVLASVVAQARAK